MAERTFVIKESRIPEWKYEITSKNYHNIAPSIAVAVRYLKDRYGSNIRIIVK